MKKAVAVLLTAAMSFSLLAGCGGSRDSSTAVTEETSTTETTTEGTTESADAGTEENAATAGEKVVIKMTKWGDAGAEAQLVEEFNASQDAIELQLDAIPSDGYGDRLTTSFSSGDGYDIFLSGEGDFYKWVSLGMVEPLDSYIAADSEWANPMSDSIMDMGVVDGTQSYLVKDYNPMCLWYNKDMFDAAEVAYPADDWTWDDLYAAAQQLTTRNDAGEIETFGFQAQSWAYALACYLESKGLSYVSEDYSTADGYLNTEAMAEALDTYFGWAEGEDRISPNAADTDTYGDGTAMMINGKLAMFITGGWAKSSLEDAGTNYATALIPGNHSSYFCASGYAISSTCKNKEAAWEVMKFLTSERASELRAEMEAVFPTSEAQLEGVVAGLSEDQQALFKTLDYSIAPVGMRGAVGNAVNMALDEMIEKIVYGEGETLDILNDTVAGLSIE